MRHRRLYFLRLLRCAQSCHSGFVCQIYIRRFNTIIRIDITLLGRHYKVIANKFRLRSSIVTEEMNTLKAIHDHIKTIAILPRRLYAIERYARATLVCLQHYATTIGNSVIAITARRNRNKKE